MSQLRRNSMFYGLLGGGILPFEYTAYDWVQADTSTGIGAVNTLYVFDLPRNTVQHRYTITTAFARTEDFAADWTSRIILGNSSETYDQCIILRKNGKSVNQLRFRYQCYMGSEYGQITDCPIEIGQWHDVVLTYHDEDVVGGKLILDGTSYFIEAPTGNRTDDKPLYLMGLPVSGHAVYPCRLSRTKIYEYSQLVADMVPAERNADGVVGFYDVVRKIFLTPSTGVQLKCGNGLVNFAQQ